jgi:cytochrome o ubiquinol oxidase subunit 2
MNRLYKLGLLVLVVAGIITSLYRYLRHANIAVLNPKGPIAAQERHLIIIVAALSLIVVIPVFTLLFTFAWRYRESNTKAKYTPDWDHSRRLETMWWLIPTLLITVISVIIWNTSHTLDPYRPLASSATPINIQVVALDWKWLFIYPQQGIATVNYVEFPKQTPVNFEITADAPMNSFWIPQLGGQIYAMPGMSAQLHLLAYGSGNFNGSSANISGRGFAGMKFIAHSTTNASFTSWVQTVRQSQKVLNTSSYNQLVKPSINNAYAPYAWTQDGLYTSIINKYTSSGGSQIPDNMQGMEM